MGRPAAFLGDHASYIPVLVAPLYWIWADPRRLLLLQVVGASRALDAGRR